MDRNKLAYNELYMLQMRLMRHPGRAEMTDEKLKAAADKIPPGVLEAYPDCTDIYGMAKMLNEHGVFVKLARTRHESYETIKSDIAASYLTAWSEIYEKFLDNGACPETDEEWARLADAINPNGKPGVTELTGWLMAGLGSIAHARAIARDDREEGEAMLAGEPRDLEM